MDNFEQTIVYNLVKNENIETVLKDTINTITTKLNQRFGSEYSVQTDDFTAPDDEWSHEIKIRKGSKIGASVDLKWEKTAPHILKLEVDESSKVGSALTLGIVTPFLLLGGFLGYNHIAPLDFLPGYRIAAILGVFTMVVPAYLLVFLLKKLLLNNETAENDTLVNEVRACLTTN
ncbi:MAG: hypothetical protein RI894_86 [Bacteroidota bacterium]|jgi:hypothetical protein